MPFAGNVYTRFKSFVNGGSFFPSDLNSIQDDFGTEITRIGKLSEVPRASSLPVSGLTNDLTTAYQSAGMQTSGTTWLLKYRSSGATYKWEFVGGAPLYSSNSTPTPENLASSGFSWQDALNSPTITVPLAGDYLIHFGAHVAMTLSSIQTGGQIDFSAYNGSARTFAVSAGIGSTSPPGNYGVQSQATGLSLVTGVTAGSTFKLQIEGSISGAGVFTTYDRFMSMTPVRLG